MGKESGDDDDLPLLPEDCLIKILVCLPVKSLLRFKSICKSWHKLIQSSFFTDLHTFNSSSSKFCAFILQTTKYFNPVDEGDVNMFMISSGDGVEEKVDIYDEDDQKKMVFKMDDLEFLPFYNDFRLTATLRMVGSCNGIICLHDPKLLDISKGIRRQHYLNLRDVSLWNPATKQFRILPKSIPIEEKQDYIATCYEDFIAFGFDVKTKDYKVLRITPWIAKDVQFSMMCRVQVYSLSTNSWSLLEGINSLPAIPNQEMYLNSGIYQLNGSYFFVGRKNDTQIYDFMLMSFDFTKEIFTTMQLSDNVSGLNLVLSYLGEKLAVFTFEMDCDYANYDIWVLNEQHSSVVVNKEYSWTKLHSFRIENRRASPCTEPRCISNNGEFALISTIIDDGRREKLQLFNLVTKEAAKKDFLFSTVVRRAEVYKESLVSIMGGNGLLKWQLPTHGMTYILNLDASFIDSRSCFGIGLCLITSDKCACIGVRSLKVYAEDATKVEALAMLEAIKWAKKLKLSPIIIESDSKNCLSFFMDDDNNLTYWSLEALSLLKEAKLLLNSSSKLGTISFQYCSRSCNYVADLAAQLGREEIWIRKDWTADFPGEMVRSLSKRGVCFTERPKKLKK